MIPVNEALRIAAEQLANTSDTARLDAELLMAHALGVTRSELLLRHMRDPSPAGFAALIERRAVHEPVAHITGSQEFYGRTFQVSPAVLIPRSDSETTVAAALEACPDPQRVLDCGVGSGALLLTILAERPEAEGVGIDRDPSAVFVALKNAERLGVNPSYSPEDAEAFLVKARASGIDISSGALGFVSRGRAGFRALDWTKRGWRKHLGRFDLVIANPPYVEDSAQLDPTVHDYEPHGALYSGPEGLKDYRALIPQLPALLEPGGVAVLEIGHRQAEAVSALAAAAGFTAELCRDLAGRPRALILRLHAT
jgi:release factor glutamine methyltransferase